MNAMLCWAAAAAAGALLQGALGHSGGCDPQCANGGECGEVRARG